MSGSVMPPLSSELLCAMNKAPPLEGSASSRYDPVSNSYQDRYPLAPLDPLPNHPSIEALFTMNKKSQNEGKKVEAGKKLSSFDISFLREELQKLNRFLKAEEIDELAKGILVAHGKIENLEKIVREKAFINHSPIPSRIKDRFSKSDSIFAKKLPCSFYIEKKISDSRYPLPKNAREITYVHILLPAIRLEGSEKKMIPVHSLIFSAGKCEQASKVILRSRDAFYNQFVSSELQYQNHFYSDYYGEGEAFPHARPLGLKRKLVKDRDGNIHDRSKAEFLMPRAYGCLSQVFRNGWFHSDFENMQKAPFTIGNFFATFFSVTDSLKEIEKTGMLHSDVKSDNILIFPHYNRSRPSQRPLHIEKGPENVSSARSQRHGLADVFLSDFGLYKQRGMEKRELEGYSYWDKLSKANFFFHTDAFGAMTTLVEFLFGGQKVVLTKPGYDKKSGEKIDQPFEILTEKFFLDYPLQNVLEHKDLLRAMMLDEYLKRKSIESDITGKPFIASSIPFLDEYFKSPNPNPILLFENLLLKLSDMDINSIPDMKQFFSICSDVVMLDSMFMLSLAVLQSDQKVYNYFRDHPKDFAAYIAKNPNDDEKRVKEKLFAPSSPIAADLEHLSLSYLQSSMEKIEANWKNAQKSFLSTPSFEEKRRLRFYLQKGVHHLIEEYLLSLKASPHLAV